MKTENDNAGFTENCSACGKPFEEGEGRFRKPDNAYCVECYKGVDANFMEICEESELT